ncbi:MAG: aminoacyl-tRNA hydrolase [Verrucomicrobiae bacterium]|jgi:PTH1 family peptidyl-tRNA hydrolase|nr:aminoacyl-tRNA hydrolase [Verrucomicrobiae bacterium]
MGNSELLVHSNTAFKASETKIRLIVGLGNPGREYDGTRHNIGFAVLDALAKDHGVSFSFESKWNADIAKIPAVDHVDAHWVLMKPRTFMNLSGTAVASYTRFFHLIAAQVLAVLDDVSLPLGKLRLRRSGSAGGQRGLESILTHFSTQEVPRMRLGVSAPEDVSQSDLEIHSTSLSHYVLAPFSKEELPLMKSSIRRAVDALGYLRQEGLDKTMNFYNP